jgi:hypothetical protein
MTGIIQLKKNHVAKVIILLWISVFSAPLFSQNGDTLTWVNPDHKSENLLSLKKGWFAGADFGSNLFYGAITLYNNFPTPKEFSRSFGRGYSVYGGKKLKFGLAAEVQAFKGNIMGEKIEPHFPTYKFSGDVMNYSVNIKYNLSNLLFREKQDRSFFNRLTMYLTVGFGQTFYRSILTKKEPNVYIFNIENATGYNTKNIDSSSGGLVTSKTARATALILPVGGKLNFRLNKKTDIVLDIYYVNVFSTSLDSWNRTWIHDDKYMYTGLGLCYNFGRTDEDEIPREQRLVRPKSKKSNEESTVSSDIDTKIPGSLPSGGKNKSSKKSKKEDKDLEIKLKLYELQLKLFEMQYMLTQ